MAIEKIKILGAVLELPALPIWSIRPNFEVNGLNWQSWLNGRTQMALRILIFSIAMGADKLFYVKSIATYAPTFFGYIISVLAIVRWFMSWFTFHQLSIPNFFEPIKRLGFVFLLSLF